MGQRRNQGRCRSAGLPPLSQLRTGLGHLRGHGDHPHTLRPGLLLPRGASRALLRKRPLHLHGTALYPSRAPGGPLSHGTRQPHHHGGGQVLRLLPPHGAGHYPGGPPGGRGHLLPRTPPPGPADPRRAGERRHLTLLQTAPRYHGRARQGGGQLCQRLPGPVRGAPPRLRRGAAAGPQRAHRRGPHRQRLLRQRQ